jgi:hypothetical protein
MHFRGLDFATPASGQSRRRRKTNDPRCACLSDTELAPVVTGSWFAAISAESVSPALEI